MTMTVPAEGANTILVCLGLFAEKPGSAEILGRIVAQGCFPIHKHTFSCSGEAQALAELGLVYTTPHGEVPHYVQVQLTEQLRSEVEQALALWRAGQGS